MLLPPDEPEPDVLPLPDELPTPDELPAPDELAELPEDPEVPELPELPELVEAPDDEASSEPNMLVLSGPDPPSSFEPDWPEDPQLTRTPRTNPHPAQTPRLIALSLEPTGGLGLCRSNGKKGSTRLCSGDRF
jgi:hypothetical protein